MKLTLFSHDVTEAHVKKLQDIFQKPLSEVKMLYITTPVRYKAVLPEWYYESHRRWLALFPKLREMDIAHTWQTDPKFDFEAYFKGFDYVFITGGNVWLLAYWLKKTGVGKVLSRQIKSGDYVYGGESAGAVICYKDIKIIGEADKVEFTPDPITDGLDVVDTVAMPHWDDPGFHDIAAKTVSRLEESGAKVVTLLNSQALFVDNLYEEVI